MTDKTKTGPFLVVGGEFADFADPAPIPGTEERYGPFADHETALRVWSERTRAKVEVCMHRLAIVPAA